MYTCVNTFLWGPPQEAVALVRGFKDVEEAAKKLTDEAYGRGSMDNITCIIIRFNSMTR